MTTTAINAERTGAPDSLQPLPDQPESWIAHEKPIPFDQAAEKILKAHRQDGALGIQLAPAVSTRVPSWTGNDAPERS